MSRVADFKRTENSAQIAEKHITANTEQDAVFKAILNAAELYMKALQLAPSSADRQRIDTKCKQLLQKAESLKSNRRDAPLTSSVPKEAGPSQPVSQRTLSKREKIIILEGSRLNSFLFKPWEAPPGETEFILRDGQGLFEDSPNLSLSSAQLDSFAGWKRPQEALGNIELAQDDSQHSNEPTMASTGKIDLVQDMTSDCSVVASLCAGTSRAERGYPKILASMVYPYDYVADRPIISQSGKYILRLNFNGCWRRVEIDDLLPMSNNSRVLHVLNRSNPRLLWPALVEKAYLKIRGGYDFPGSNSGTDLAVLTGWIPQQIFLHDEEVEPEDLWTRIYNGFRKGNLLLTMGTGKLPKREQRLLGLAAEHDYAVLDMKEEANAKEMLIKNPWSDGDVWRGAARRRPNLSQDSTPEIPSVDGQDTSMTPGTFWMDFSSVFQHFENLYVNWNPELFAKRQDMHFTWDLSESNQALNLFLGNPQFRISSSKGGEIWLLLNKHFKTGDYSRATAGHNGYISLYIYHQNTGRILSSDGAKLRGPFVDSPNTLLTFQLLPNQSVVAVIASQSLPTEKHNFTLSAFSNAPILLEEALTKYHHDICLSAAWTRSTAGGNSDSPNYLSNPQFRARIEADHDVSLVLRVMSPVQFEASTSEDIHVKILVLSSDGRRITKLRARDIVAHSGDYRRGTAVIETDLARGNYTIICSTFDPDQHAKFTLTLQTALPGSAAVLQALPSENSGRLSILCAPAVFTAENNRLLVPIILARSTRAIFVARSATNPFTKQVGLPKPVTASLFKLTIEEGQGPYKKTLASSSSDADATSNDGYASINTGLRLPDTDLQPSMHGPGTGGLWLVIQKLAPSTVSAGNNTAAIEQEDERVLVEIWADERLEVGPWGLGEG